MSSFNFLLFLLSLFFLAALWLWCSLLSSRTLPSWHFLMNSSSDICPSPLKSIFANNWVTLDVTVSASAFRPANIIFERLTILITLTAAKKIDVLSTYLKRKFVQYWIQPVILFHIELSKAENIDVFITLNFKESGNHFLHFFFLNISLIEVLVNYQILIANSQLCQFLSSKPNKYLVTLQLWGKEWPFI